LAVNAAGYDKLRQAAVKRRIAAELEEPMKTRTLAIVSTVFLAAFCRLVPHPPNFTPIAALALFGAALLPNKGLAMLLPLVAMFLSDLGLHAVSAWRLGSGWMGAGSGFHRDMWFVYATVALITALGFLLRGRRTVASVGTAALASSLLFFLLTNFGVWGVWDMYPKTWAGLVECYLAAIPFFHWTLLGDVCYATVLFGGFALAEQHWPQLAERPAVGAPSLD
jgi:hypothetical protein